MTHPPADVPGTETRPIASWHIWLLVAVTLGCLLPFLAKPVHMDDPLFIWTARHIQTDPLHFYDFPVNWNSVTSSMADVMQNPPLAAYYLAFVGSLLGWTETALHFGFLWPALAAVLGVYFLGREFCHRPLFAALAALATPAFLVSNTSLMCDTMMLALWLWSLFFWMRGLAQSSPPQLALAVFFAALAASAKYFGLCLIPLLAVYAALTQRKIGSWLICLGGLILVLAAGQWWTQRVAGKNLFMDAVGYATHLRVGGGLPSKIVTGLSFTGGCILIVPATIPLLWGKRGLFVALACFALLALFLAARKSIAGFSLVDAGRLNWLFIAQWSFFVIGGAALLFLAITDVLRHRDAKSLLLLLWIFGTFAFACACNWTVAARNILPMVPAAAFLLLRRLEFSPNPECRLRFFWWPLAFSLAAAFVVARADYKFAQAARTAAQTIYEKTVWQFKNITFEGHWGFQYYMEQLGATPIDKRRVHFARDTAIIVPFDNSLVFLPPKDSAVLWDEFDISSPIAMAVMSMDDGAGFYSDGWGPVPFVLCRPPVERYQIYRGK